MSELLGRRFQDGQAGEAGGVEWRVRSGYKNSRREGQQDLVLDIRTPGGEWVAVGMPLSFLIADFLHENEDVLYPPEQGFRGGRMFMDYLNDAPGLGWAEVEARLRDDQRRKDC